MSWYTLSLLILVQSLSTAANGAAWPYVDNPRIIHCTNGSQGKCSNSVFYQSDGVVFIDIAPVGRPDPALGTKIRALGIHCYYGNSVTGKPFSGCSWVNPWQVRHAPQVTGKCELKNTNAWELTPDSTCSTSHWAQHAGAGPGGECVIFTQVPKIQGRLLNTPFGMLAPDTVANSGNRFCQKALPPDVRCDLDIPNSIDHQTLPPRGSNSVTVVGSIACGATPVVEIVGGDVVVLGAGVKSRLSTNVTSAAAVALTSKLTVTNAAPGEYRGAAVVRVSPY
ncbi:Uncharacterised protein [Serratia marcescens]|nr:Uncharacterised protein [Serratia marcescens]